jgi:hypothetical protein
MSTISPRTVAQLQRTAGNAAVAALLGGGASRAGVGALTASGVARDAVPGAPASRVVQRAVSREQASSIADKLHDAMAGWGTDEDAIYAALGGRTGDDIVAIRNAYRRYGDLDADLADELTDDELAHVRELMPPVANESSLPREQREEAAVDRARVIATQLKNAMAGWGTDEDSIFAALSGRSQDEVGEIKRQYLELTGRYLERDLQDELSGEDLRRAFNLLDTAGEFDRVGFSECDPLIREKLRAFVPIARSKVAAAIAALEPGWSNVSGAVRSSFQTYFDPGNSGQIDDRFVELVLDNFRTIGAYMAEGLDFDCELTSGSLCGDGIKWCGEGAGNGRLYWTCFGDIHVCANSGWTAASDERRWSDIIHESTHNALHTTDRVYCGRTGWTELTPYGRGVTSALMDVPIIGFVARLAGGGGDTLHNPDSYSHFAQER